MAEVAKDPTGEGSEKVPKKGLMTGKYKWWVVGGLGVVAVLVFVFVRKSSASGAATTAGSASTTLDPATQAALQSALQGQAMAGQTYSAATGPQGPAGPTGPTGPAGPTGTAGAAGAAGKPGTPAVVHQQVPPASKQTQTVYYTVKPGDNLTSIASRLHTQYNWSGTVAQNAANLYSTNRNVIGSNPNLIIPGQKLKVP